MSLIPDISLENEKVFDYEKTFKSCLMDLNKPIDKPPIALAIGYNQYSSELNATFTYGEMSTIIAPQKTKKTFFKTALIANYIGGKANEYFPDMVSKREGEKYVIDIDTEMGEYYAQQAFRRVSKMVGREYANYLPFGTKKLSDEERLMLIDGIVNDPRYKGKIGWISIDGVADLCENTNDIIKSKQVIKKLMEWNSQGIHINAVLHKTFEKDRGTGHIGSECQKKSESVIFLHTVDETNRNSPILVKQKDSRGAPFENFHFDLDQNTVLPKQCNEPKW